MFSKFFAAWLVAIIALPFTAPLATCDVADILHSVHHDAPLGRRIPAADTSTSTTPPLATAAGALRLDAVGDTLVASARECDIFVLRARSVVDPPPVLPHRSDLQQVLRL
jgi:hypothetical protein